MLIDKTAEELLSMDRDALKSFRGQLFLGGKRKNDTLEQMKALLEFCTLLSIVQDMVDWRKLSEPGIAGTLIQAGDEDLEEEIEEARELDRLSIDQHAEIAEEFERRGGKAAFQAAIDKLNALHAG